MRGRVLVFPPYYFTKQATLHNKNMQGDDLDEKLLINTYLEYQWVAENPK